MENNQNIGEWVAIVKNEGKTPQIFVNGTFPTNGEKPLYHLTKNDPQGINPTELLLTLSFGSLATQNGTVFFSVYFNEAISPEQYQTVLVVDEKGKRIAGIRVSYL